MELSELIKVVEWAYANPVRTLKVDIHNGAAFWAVALNEEGVCKAVESMEELENLSTAKEAEEREQLAKLQAKYGKGE